MRIPVSGRREFVFKQLLGKLLSHGNELLNSSRESVVTLNQFGLARRIEYHLQWSPNKSRI